MPKNYFVNTLLMLSLSAPTWARISKIDTPIPFSPTKVTKQENFVLKNAKGTIIGKQSISSLTDWMLLDPFTDLVEGTSTQRVYSELGVTIKSDAIVVAVIDSGVDIHHQDLVGKIWINKAEVPSNGIDDDNNGYIDDVNGWNFIGGRDGSHIDADTLEVTREYARLKKKIQNFETLSKKEKALYEEVKAEVETNYNNAKTKTETYQARLDKFLAMVKFFKEVVGLSEVNIETLSNLNSEDPIVKENASYLLGELTRGITPERLQGAIDYFAAALHYHYNENYNPRALVGDDYSNPSDRFYGNNDVIGPDASHGTHVSGIIAANRNNELGMQGIAENVLIMPIRAVPNGDERDKDVGNAIIYAVDNGAKIINMSFGKAYSPYKAYVDKAVKYAEEKGVLLVHAAGNSSKNNDLGKNFPNKNYKGESTEASNWIEVGASSSQKGLALPAEFSNYGKKSVDLFAPGVEIYSTTPNNHYEFFDGTSMASPVVAGVATLVWSQFPAFNSAQIKDVLMQSSRRHPNLKVYLPGTENPVFFSELSVTGGIVNSYNAMKAAATENNKNR